MSFPVLSFPFECAISTDLTVRYFRSHCAISSDHGVRYAPIYAVLGGFIFVFAQFAQVAQELYGLIVGLGALFLAEECDLFPNLLLTGG